MTWHNNDLPDEFYELRAENERLRTALLEILHASRDDGLSEMVNWMRGRALAAIAGESMKSNNV